MNDLNNKPAGLQRFVLIFLGLGLIGMFVSFMYISFTQPNIVVHNILKESDVQTGEGDAMAASLMARLEENPEDYEVLHSLASHFLHTGDLEKAEPLAHRAIKVNPVMMKTHYVLGIIQHKKGLHETSVKTLEHALSLEDTASLRYNLGVLYAFFLQDVARGKAMLEKALELSRDDPSLTKSIESIMQQLVKPESS